MIVGGTEIQTEQREMIKKSLNDSLDKEQYLVSMGNTYLDIAGVHISFLEALTALRYQQLNPQKEYRLSDGELQSGVTAN